MTLDMRSLYMMLLIVHFSFALFQLGMWKIRPNSPGMLLWGLSNVTTGVASVLLILRDHIPDVLSIILGNGFYLNSWALMWCGQRQFNGQTHSTAWYWLPSLIVMLAFQFVPLFEDTRARICATHAILALLAMASYWDMHKAQQREHLSTRRVIMGVYVFSAGMSVLRIALTMAGTEIHSYMEPNAVQSTMQVLGLIVSVSWNLILLLMTQERLQNQLTQAAQVDVLTQTLNRSGFAELSARTLERGVRNGETSTVLLLDLDNFKRVNDTHGHGAGDQLLRAFADAARRALRPSDLLARRGGEEFCVMLPQVGSGQARQVAERIRVEFAATGVWNGDVRVNTTVSIGVAEIRTGETVEQALHRADNALYEAKTGGRNRVQLAPA